VPSALLQADSAHDTGFMLSLSSLTGAKLSWSFAPLLAVGRSLVEGVLSLFQHAVTAGKQKHRGPVAYAKTKSKVTVKSGHGSQDSRLLGTSHWLILLL